MQTVPLLQMYFSSPSSCYSVIHRRFSSGKVWLVFVLKKNRGVHFLKKKQTGFNFQLWIPMFVYDFLYQNLEVYYHYGCTKDVYNHHILHESNIYGARRIKFLYLKLTAVESRKTYKYNKSANPKLY